MFSIIVMPTKWAILIQQTVERGAMQMGFRQQVIQQQQEIVFFIAEHG